MLFPDNLQQRFDAFISLFQIAEEAELPGRNMPDQTVRECLLYRFARIGNQFVPGLIAIFIIVFLEHGQFEIAHHRNRIQVHQVGKQLIHAHAEIGHCRQSGQRVLFEGFYMVGRYVCVGSRFSQRLL